MKNITLAMTIKLKLATETLTQSMNVMKMNPENVGSMNLHPECQNREKYKA